MPAKPDRDSSSSCLLYRAAPTGLSIIRPPPAPAKCELDTDGFLPQSGFLLDKQDPGQAHAIIIHLGKTGHVAFEADIL